jgi:hypothetical protein
VCCVLVVFIIPLSLFCILIVCLCLPSTLPDHHHHPPFVPRPFSQLKLFYAPLLSRSQSSLSQSLDSGLVQAPTLPPFRLPPTHLSIHSVAVCGSNAPLASTCPSLLHHHSLRTFVHPLRSASDVCPSFDPISLSPQLRSNCHFCLPPSLFFFSNVAAYLSKVRIFFFFLGSKLLFSPSLSTVCLCRNNAVCMPSSELDWA